MTLVEQLTTFMYNYPVQHHKKELLRLVELAEAKYIARIQELESKLDAQEEPSPVILDDGPYIARYGDEEDGEDDY